MGALDGVDVFPIENRDIPASYVPLPEGITKRPLTIPLVHQLVFSASILLSMDDLIQKKHESSECTAPGVGICGGPSGGPILQDGPPDTSGLIYTYVRRMGEAPSGW